jgi:hypothetical protein
MPRKKAKIVKKKVNIPVFTEPKEKVEESPYAQTLKEEAKTWLIEDPLVRAEKIQRETVRYPLLARQMGLHHIDTSNMVVFDIGCGPMGGVSSVIPNKMRALFDPLAHEYKKHFSHVSINAIKGEDLSQLIPQADLVIVTNALDHFESPIKFLYMIKAFMKPGAYFAHLHAINNAITHPHPAHIHNINPQIVDDTLSTDFEKVWELKYPEIRYGWVQYQGKVGQPAFSQLWRKTTGYK